MEKFKLGDLCKLKNKKGIYIFEGTKEQCFGRSFIFTDYYDWPSRNGNFQYGFEKNTAKKVTLSIGNRVIFDLDGIGKQKGTIKNLHYPICKEQDLMYQVEIDGPLAGGIVPAMICKKLVKKQYKFRVGDTAFFQVDGISEWTPIEITFINQNICEVKLIHPEMIGKFGHYYGAPVELNRLKKESPLVCEHFDSVVDKLMNKEFKFYSKMDNRIILDDPHNEGKEAMINHEKIKEAIIKFYDGWRHKKPFKITETGLYKTRAGVKVTIDKIEPVSVDVNAPNTYSSVKGFRTDARCMLRMCWGENGKYYMGESEFDIVEKIEEPVPADFKITGPGVYETRNSRLASVTLMKDSPHGQVAIGHVHGDNFFTWWEVNGTCEFDLNHSNDLVKRISDLPETIVVKQKIKKIKKLSLERSPLWVCTDPRIVSAFLATLNSIEKACDEVLDGD